MTRRLRCDHDHVEIGARHDLVVVDRETVGESQGCTLLQVRLDLVLVQAPLKLVRSQNHHQVSRSNSFLHRLDGQTMGLCLGHRRRTSAQANHYVNAGILQIAGVSMALGAVTDDCDFLALDDGKIAVLIVGNLHVIPPLLASWTLQ